MEILTRKEIIENDLRIAIVIVYTRCQETKTKKTEVNERGSRIDSQRYELA